MIATPDLVSAGEHLAGARSARGLSIEDVAHETRIPAGHIRALEAGEYQRFDGAGYTRSFLRMYGNYLDVDVTDGLAQLQEQRELSGKVNHYPFLDAPDKVRFASELVAPRSSAVPLISVISALLLVIAVPMAFLVAKHYFVAEEPGTAMTPDPVGLAPEVPLSVDHGLPPGTRAAVDLNDIAKIPTGQLERIREQAQPEVRRAEVVGDEPEDGETVEDDSDDEAADAEEI